MTIPGSLYTGFYGYPVLQIKNLIDDDGCINTYNTDGSKFSHRFADLNQSAESRLIMQRDGI